MTFQKVSLRIGLDAGEGGKTQRLLTAPSSSLFYCMQAKQACVGCSTAGSTGFTITASSAAQAHPAILLQLLLLLLQALRHVLLVHLWVLHPQINISTGELPIRGFCHACLHYRGAGGKKSRQSAVTARFVIKNLVLKKMHPASQRI